MIFLRLIIVYGGDEDELGVDVKKESDRQTCLDSPW